MNVIGLKITTDEGLIEEELRASSLIEPFVYEPKNQYFLCQDNTVGVVFECVALTGGDQADQDHLEQVIDQDYPEGTTAQFFLFKSPDIERELIAMETLRGDFSHPLLNKVVEDRIEFLHKHTTEPIVTKTSKNTYRDVGKIFDTKLIVSFKFPIEGDIPTPEEEVAILSLATKTESALVTAKLQPVRMTAKAYIRLMSTIFNWSERASWRGSYWDKWEEDKFINEQIFDYTTDVVKVDDSTVSFGDNVFVKSLSAKTFPTSMYFTEALLYAGDLKQGEENLRQSYAVVTNLYFGDPVKLKNSLMRKRQWIVNQSYSMLTRYVPVLAEKEKSFNILYDSLNKGARAVKMSFSLLLFGNSVKEVQEASVRATTLWRSLHFSLFEDKFVVLPMLKNNLPLCTDSKAIEELQRYKTLTSKEVPVLLPVFGEWKGTGRFHVALISRNGQLMSFSIHDTNNDKNAVIAAQAGSGKSFLLNEMILAYMSEGAKVWIIDAGKSYKKLCESLDGDFIQFDDKTRICLNPFELIEDWKEDQDAIFDLVRSMAAPEGGLTIEQEAMLKKILKESWNKYGKAMTVDRIVERCMEEQDQRFRDIGTLLYAFTSSGNHGHYFAGHNNVNFKNQITVLELDELQGRLDLRQVVLMQLIFQIQREVYTGERNRKKLVIIDEAWDLLSQGDIGKFMEHAYRKFRKYGASAVIATQSIADLFNNTVGKAISDNSATKILLGQTAEAVESAKENKQLVMSEGHWNLLKTVRTETGVFSEMFIHQKDRRGVGRLIVSDYQKALYSTVAEHVNFVEKLRAQGLTLDEALKEFVRQQNGE